jgi:hypothetical protein
MLAKRVVNNTIVCTQPLYPYLQVARYSGKGSIDDAGKSIFLDIDGAMSYSMVWLNGRFVGGWPYGYASFRLNLTPYVNPGGKNVLAIRLDNPLPRSMARVSFEVSGPGELVATDNGDPTDMTAFPSKERKTFNGLALAIVRAKPGEKGEILMIARSNGLREAQIAIIAK